MEMALNNVEEEEETEFPDYRMSGPLAFVFGCCLSIMQKIDKLISKVPQSQGHSSVGGGLV